MTALIQYDMVAEFWLDLSKILLKTKNFMKIKTVFWSVFLLMTYVLDTSAGIPDSKPVKSFALKLYQEKEYYRTITETLRISTIEPELKKDPELELLLASSYFYLNEFQNTLDTLTGNESNPGFIRKNLKVPFHFLKTASYLSLGLDEQAEKEAEMLPYMDGDLLPLKKNLNDQKNPETAKMWSTFIPGTGLIYAGEYQSGVVSFLLNTLFIAGIHQHYSEQNYGIAALLFFFEIGWYQGGREAAFEAAEHRNRRKLKNLREDWIKARLVYLKF